MEKACLLLVEDYPPLLQMMSSFLPRKGYAVTCCATAAEALAALSSGSRPHDAAIVDMGLPDMDGRELVIQLAARSPDIRFLVASGTVMDPESLDVAPAGRVSFLLKPYDPRMLIASIENLLSSRS